jgi:trk system potassium uptake protein TrkH
MATVAARLRRAVGPGSLGVDLGGAINLVGALLRYLSLAFLFPAVLAVGYGEPVLPFAAAGAVTAVLGLGLELVTHGRERVGVREGFLVVALTWLLGAAVVSLPYILSGEEQISRPLDAYFEAMSGMTTTGASVLTDIPALDRSLLMWRQFSQWLGGMGIIVLALAVLPRLRVGGRQLMESELPGPELEALTASIRDTARRLWLLYVALTAVLVLALATLGWTGVDGRMDLFNAVAHAFTTMPTGGFGTEPRSIEPFAPASQWVLALFMILAGANFALLYRAFVHRKPGALVRDDEFRLYLGLLALGSALLTVVLWDAGLFGGGESVRQAVFQTVSIMTTTGYASTDFTQWLVVAPIAATVLVALMFPGGSAGSTAGSIKVVRHLVIGRILKRELDQTVHPEYVAPIRINRVAIDERTVRAVIAFVLLYVGIFVVGALLLLLEGYRVDLELSPFAAIAASATTLGNIGPAFGLAGPMGSFEPFSDPSKGVMIALMWIGRLEIVPVVVLLTRSYWRA